MSKMKKWFPILFGLLLVVTLIAVKGLSEQKQRKIAAQEQAVAPKIKQIIEGTSDSYHWPMAKTGLLQNYAEFGKASRFPNLYHSAADYFAAPGTEVYAVSDGVVYFSGAESGYGALVIVEHKKDGLYSLYGHVSARRWLIEKGEPVTKGQLIGYIADTDEGYGIGIVPHLHFSMRLGAPSDYPQSGRSNWMTGYTTNHPVFHQFLDPNDFIAQSKRYHRDKEPSQQ